MGYDPERTRASILEAAVEEFAEHGGAGARIDRIAARAGANKEAIYRYYGSKNDLLHRVLDEFLTERGDETVPDADDPVAYPAELMRKHAANQNLVRLTTWEGMEYGAEIDEQSVASRRLHYERKLAAVRAAQQAGVIDPDLDPRHLLMVFIGMANWLFVSPQVARMILGHPVDDATVEQHADFLLECARRICAPPAAGSGDADTDADAAQTPKRAAGAGVDPSSVDPAFIRGVEVDTAAAKHSKGRAGKGGAASAAADHAPTGS